MSRFPTAWRVEFALRQCLAINLMTGLTCMGLTLYRKPVLTRGSMYTPITGIWWGACCGTRYTAGTSPNLLASSTTSLLYVLSFQYPFVGTSTGSYKINDTVIIFHCNIFHLSFMNKLSILLASLVLQKYPIGYRFHRRKLSQHDALWLLY